MIYKLRRCKQENTCTLTCAEFARDFQSHAQSMRFRQLPTATHRIFLKIIAFTY